MPARSWPRPFMGARQSITLAGTLVHEADENVFERALARVEVLEGDALVAQPPQQRRDAGALGIGVELIFELGPFRLQLQRPFRKRAGYLAHRLGEVQRQRLAAELLHQRG